MHTIVLRSNPRKGSSGLSVSIEVIGDSPVKEGVRQSIRELEHHPAKATRRALIDMLNLIEKHNFRIRHAERSETDDGLESWLFVLQG